MPLLDIPFLENSIKPNLTLPYIPNLPSPALTLPWPPSLAPDPVVLNRAAAAHKVNVRGAASHHLF